MSRRAMVVWAAVLCGAGAFAPAGAQQPKTPPDVTRDTDRDGVPDIRDRCPGTPAGTRVDVNGCPVASPAPTQQPAAGAPAAPAPAPGAITQQAAQPGAAQPGAARPVTPPAGAAQPAGAPTGAAQPAPQPNVARPAGAAAPGGAAPAVVPPAPAPISVSPTGQPAAQPTPAAGQPAGAAPAAARPGAAPAPAANQPPRAVPAAPAPSAATTDATLTEGFLMRGWVPNSGRPALEYLRDYALKLDSAAVTLRSIFSTASGQPVAGATDPTKLVTREKLRWRRCRNMKEDIQTFADNVPLLQDSIPPTMREQWSTLGERFDSLQAVLENCETIAFMIESPERYTPWQTNYETSARAFYGEWYGKLRAMHEALRQVARLVAAQLPATAERRQALQMMPNLPPTAPTPGGH